MAQLLRYPGMERGSAPADVLLAATHVDERVFECLADCRTQLVRTFEDAKRALREQLYRLIVIDLNFDGVRTFDLLQHVCSLADFKGVPIICLQTSEQQAGAVALDHVVRGLGGRAFFDLRGEGEKVTQAFQHLCQLVGEARCSNEALQRRIARAQAGLCTLIVDCDIDAAHALGDLLEDLGHDVDYAYDRSAGADAARRLRPDVIFIAECFHLATQLRRESACRDAFIVSLVEAPADERDAGIDDWVTKPVDPARIKSLLAKRRAGVG